MANRLFCLWHHTVIGGNHNNGDIRHARATRSHRREGLVSWGIEEEDGAIATLHLARSKMLGNATAFARSHTCLAQCVEQARFAVVDMAHHCDDWGACDQRCPWGFAEEFGFRCSGWRLRGRLWCYLRFVRLRLLYGEAELGRNERGRLAINALVHGGKDTAAN